MAHEWTWAVVPNRNYRREGWIDPVLREHLVCRECGKQRWQSRERCRDCFVNLRTGSRTVGWIEHGINCEHRDVCFDVYGRARSLADLEETQRRWPSPIYAEWLKEARALLRRQSASNRSVLRTAR
jgi:hypothetical protein